MEEKKASFLLFLLFRTGIGMAKLWIFGEREKNFYFFRKKFLIFQNPPLQIKKDVLYYTGV